MNCRKLVESKNLVVNPIHRNLSQIISESYGLLYSTDNPKIKRLTESLIQDIRKNPLATTELSYNLQCIKRLEESKVQISMKDIETTLREDEELEDPRLETGEATIDQMTAVTTTEEDEPEHDAPKADPDEVVRFAENSRNKSFYRALSKMSSFNEATKTFNLQEVLSTYKSVNSAMTQMAIEYEHNNAFRETFTVLTSVLGRAAHSLLESLYNNVPITEESASIISRFSRVLCEDTQEEVDDFIDWVTNEYEGDEEEETPKVPEDLSVDQAKEIIDTVVDTVYPEGAPEQDDSQEDSHLEDDVAELSDAEKAEVQAFLCILRGCEPDSEEAKEEPTEDEIDALESRIRSLRKKSK